MDYNPKNAIKESARSAKYKEKYKKYKIKYISLKNTTKQFAGDGTIEPSLNLLRDHGVDNDRFNQWKKFNKIPRDKAFCLLFELRNKKLYYIGAKHTTDTGSETFLYIHKIITESKPDIVLLEGIPYSLGISPRLSNMQGESKFAIDLAIENKIPYIGIEPNENNILLNISNKFNKDDIYGYMYLGMYKYHFVTLKSGENQLQEFFEKYELPNLEKSIGKIPFNFHEWFKSKFNKSFIYGEDLEYASPTDSDIITQKISYELAKMRDAGIIINLYKVLNTYDKILFICGQNHLYAHLKILEETFGGFKKIKLNDNI